jgi:hypothetical protein
MNMGTRDLGIKTRRSFSLIYFFLDPFSVVFLDVPHFFPHAIRTPPRPSDLFIDLLNTYRLIFVKNFLFLTRTVALREDFGTTHDIKMDEVNSFKRDALLLRE